MKRETSFLELDYGLIVVSVAVTGPARRANARFVLDTGAAVTTITHVFDLGGMQIQGLLGMNFLSNFNYEIRSGEHRILAEKIAA